MKKTLLTIVALFAFGTVANATMTNTLEEKEIIASINDALLPTTVEANTEVSTVLSGLFPNGCYRYKQSSVKHDHANKVHEVQTTALVSQGMCIMVLVPFTKEVALGKFEAGAHRVRYMNGDGTYMEKRVVAK